MEVVNPREEQDRKESLEAHKHYSNYDYDLSIENRNEK